MGFFPSRETHLDSNLDEQAQKGLFIICIQEGFTSLNLSITLEDDGIYWHLTQASSYLFNIYPLSTQEYTYIRINILVL